MIVTKIIITFRQINDNLTKKNYEGGYQSIYLFLKITNFLYTNTAFKLDLYLCNDKKLGNFNSLGQTEKAFGAQIIFQKFFLLDYIFEREQPLRIVISSPVNTSLQYVINTTVANFMGTRYLSTRYEVKNESGQVAMELQLEAKNAKESQEIARFCAECKFNQEFFGVSNKINNVFYVLSNFTDGKNFRKVYKSEEVSMMNMLYEEMQIEKAFLFDSENDPVKIEFYDMNYEVFAVSNTSISEIKNKNSVEIFNTKDNIQIGFAKIQLGFEIRKTFIDYLSEGMQINLVIGIDFTASNGSPHEQKSLHFCNSAEPNFYERAIISCGNILNYYDYDKIYPVFGFGAQMMGSNTVNHCFNLNFQQIPNINGIDSVIATYKQNLYQLNFSGPTYFTPLIRNVIEMIRCNIMNSNDLTYYILLILTDGQVCSQFL